MSVRHSRIRVASVLALLVSACLCPAQQPVKRRAASPASTANAGDARIVRVEQLARSAEERPLLTSPEGRYLPKFVIERRVGGQPYRIVWRPPTGGLPNGATVFFEYRLVGDKALRREFVQLTCPVRTEQATTITVPALVSGPPVVEQWRVVLMAGKTVLAERFSPNWSPR
jgi:hypothetical protein